MPDHIHVAISISPTIAVAEFVRLTKGSTSHFLNKDAAAARLGWFGWQAELACSHSVTMNWNASSTTSIDNPNIMRKTPFGRWQSAWAAPENHRHNDDEGRWLKANG